MKHYEIRPAIPQDAPEIATLVARGMRGYPFESVYDAQATYQDILQGANQRVVAVEHATQTIVGTAVLGDTRNTMQEIKRVVVNPELRGSGIANEMTKWLTQLAQENATIPWVDARGCQPAMQKAALNAGHQAISLETGKHCVYAHQAKDANQEIGPARETMVHLTSLVPNYHELEAALAQWPLDLVTELARSLVTALDPQEKNTSIVDEILPSAAEVKDRILNNLHNLWQPDMKQTKLNADLALLTLQNDQMVVVAPDASGFVISQPDQNLATLVQVGHEIGLQTVTTYVNANNTQALETLQAARMKPTMLRLWQDTPDLPPTWQVGWRSITEDFEHTLHYLRLHPLVLQQLLNMISRL